MTPESDVIEVCELLTKQKELLSRIHHAATELPSKVMAKADLANFLLYHGLHIRELVKAALILMENREPYAVVLLSRPALESAFIMGATMNDPKFGPQRSAFEYEDIARKLELLIKKDVWPRSRRPTPEQCRKKAAEIRKEYNAPALTEKRERDRIEKIERIAEVADLTPLYDDEYRQLSLTVHSNQAGILNAGSGFLVRKGMLAICIAALQASASLCDAFRLRANYNDKIQEHEARLADLMRQPDHLPDDPQDIFGKEPGANGHKRFPGKI
jgi:hypothetical protein